MNRLYKRNTHHGPLHIIITQKFEKAKIQREAKAKRQSLLSFSWKKATSSANSMHRSLSMNFQPRFLSQQRQTQVMMANRAINIMEPCDVFINHRSKDTKRTLATLLYDHLRRLGFHPFLDNKTMKPGDKLFHKINSAILECKIGLAVISPRYCESYFCLHELALLMESKKKVIPIFCDVKPSQLRVINNKKWTAEDLQRFKLAIEEAKYTVGLNFNSAEGNFSDIVISASDIIIKSLIELEDMAQVQHPNFQPVL